MRQNSTNVTPTNTPGLAGTLVLQHPPNTGPEDEGLELLGFELLELVFELEGLDELTEELTLLELEELRLLELAETDGLLELELWLLELDDG